MISYSVEWFLLKIISGQILSPILNSKAIKENPSKMGAIDYDETSLTVYQYKPCNTQKGEDLIHTTEKACSRPYSRTVSFYITFVVPPENEICRKNL